MDMGVEDVPYLGILRFEVCLGELDVWKVMSFEGCIALRLLVCGG
jgi:hypothetical protein